MSDASSRTRLGAGRRIAIGLLRLTDSAPAIVAHEFGFFADEDLSIALSVEPSWANVADKLAYGALDAAVIVPPARVRGLARLARPRRAAHHSLRPQPRRRHDHPRQGPRRRAQGWSAQRRIRGARAERLKASGGGTTLAVVHDYSTRNLLLRYWLAAAGALAGRDYKIPVTPPARTVEALKGGKIAGFCAGAPWRGPLPPPGRRRADNRASLSPRVRCRIR